LRRVRRNETAIDAGNPDAMNNLGLLYLRGKCIRRDGDGVSRNAKLARQWFEKAAARGNVQAKQNLRAMRH